MVGGGVRLPRSSPEDYPARFEDPARDRSRETLVWKVLFFTKGTRTLSEKDCDESIMTVGDPPPVVDSD